VTFVVLYDANVLYPSSLRDLLIRIAQGALVQAKWTNEILDEVFRNLKKNRPDLDVGKLARTRELMIKAVRDCLVLDYEPLIQAITLPDVNDRHVVAAAIKSHAQVIVTNNLKDFPSEELKKWNIEAKSADAFVLDQIYLNKAAVYSSVQQIADSLRKPPGTIEDVLIGLEKRGLIESVAALRRNGPPPIVDNPNSL
jgi:predicted nucleic acid-binding protein